MDEQVEKLAVIMVDLQRDFLTPDHFFTKLNCDLTNTRSILPKIASLTSSLRESKSNNISIIWVYSTYGENDDMTDSKSLDLYRGNYFNAPADRLAQVPLNNALLSTTHEQTVQNPCCARNSSGSAFCEEVEVLLDTNADSFVEKQFYSAFRKTSLLALLREKNIPNVAVCGVATDYCCNATYVDAYHLGFNVYFVKDCVSAQTEQGHTAALNAINPNAISIVTADQLISKFVRPNSQ